VVDTSSAKSMVVKDDYPAPQAEVEIRKIAGPRKDGRVRCLFSSWDVPCAYYCVSYHSKSPIESRLIVFEDETYVFDCLIMGGPSSMAALNKALDSAFEDLIGISHVADDCRGGAVDDDDYIAVNRAFLERCRQHKIFLRPSKSIPISTVTHWCGFHVDSQGFRADPRSKEIVLAWKRPQFGNQLAKAIGVANWMKISLPGYDALKKPLQEILERMYKSVGNNRRNSAIAKLKVEDFGWNIHTDNVWEQLKQKIINAVNVAHRDPTKVLILYTDASLVGWTAVLCQVNPSDLAKSPAERNNEPLAFLGGPFNSTQSNWPTVEQEAFGVRKSVERFWYYINDSTKLVICTDNKALRDVFDPTSDYVMRREKPGQGRLRRWAAFMREIPNYEIQHIPGEENAVSDFISRMNLPPETFPFTRSELDEEDAECDNSISTSFATFTSNYINLMMDANWRIPTIFDIQLVAGKDGRKNPVFYQAAKNLKCTFSEHEKLWKTLDDKILIPEELRQSLLFAVHANLGGHRGKKATLDQLSRVVFWPDMEKDVEAFVSKCISCMHHDPRRPVRPYGRTIVANDRGQILCADFLHLSDGQEGYKKLLILSDKFSKFSMFFPTNSENAEIAAHSILNWISLFGIPRCFASDRGTAWNNSLIKAVADKLKMDYHFISARAHWSLGSQERINASLRNLFRTIITDNHLDYSQWNEILHVVQMSFNHSPLLSLNNLAPVTVFNGLPPSQPIDIFTIDNEIRTVNFNSIKDFVQELCKKLEEQSIEVYELQEQAFHDRQRRQFGRRGVSDLNATVGDYLLVLEHNPVQAKLSPRWVGPVIVLDILEDRKYKVQYIHNKKIEIVHDSFLKFFETDDLEDSPELRKHASYVSAQKYVIKQLLGIIKSRNGQFYFEVEWDGGDITREPAAMLYKDVPQLVLTYLKDIPSRFKKLVPGVKKVLGLE
jgi:hypothetical protein